MVFVIENPQKKDLETKESLEYLCFFLQKKKLFGKKRWFFLFERMDFLDL